MSIRNVYAITPNPALDLNGVAVRIVANEKNYITHESRYPGGNAINSARILTQLKCRVQVSGFLGGAVGQQIESLLKIEKVNSDFISIAKESRINITISNRETHTQSRFSFPGPTIKNIEKTRLLKKLSLKSSNTLFLLGGSFPPNFGVQDAKRIVKNGHRNKIAVIIDVPPKHLKELLAVKPLMIKPNLFEFEQLIGKKLKTLPQIIAEGKKLTRHCPLVCISSVNKGVLLITRSKTYFARAPRIKPKSSVGAGDSLVGGIAAGILKHKLTYEQLFSETTSAQLLKNESIWSEILKLGLGSALATICLPGTELGKAKEILKFARKVVVKEIV